MPQPHIVYGVDSRYLAPLLASMYSILRHTSSNVRLTILTTDPPIAQDDPHLGRLQDVFPESEIRIQYFDGAPLSEYGQTTSTGWPAASLLPLFIPWLVEDRCLFLDADTLVLCDITKLYNMDMGGKPFGACQSPTTALTVTKHLTFGLHSIVTPVRTRQRRRELHEWSARMGFTFEELRTKYFSSGILLYETKAIREMDPNRELANVELSRKHWSSMPDMDRLNEFFKDQVFYLNLKWNVYRDILLFNRVYASAELWAQVTAAARDPAMLHYPAFFRRKPWRRPWYKRKLRHKIYTQTCQEMELRTGIEILRLLDQAEKR